MTYLVRLFLISALIYSGAIFAIDTQKCLSIAEMTYQRCTAGCDREADLEKQQWDSHGIGAGNAIFNRQMQQTFQGAVNNGYMQQSQLDALNNFREYADESVRVTRVSTCENRCDSEKEELMSLCYR